MSTPGQLDEAVGGQVEDLVRRVLADGQVGRRERGALERLLRDASLAPSAWRAVVERVIRAAKARDPRDQPSTLDSLGEVFVAVLFGLHPDARARNIAGVAFSPGIDCRSRILSVLEDARRTVDVCVYSITDDAITRALCAARRRGVAVRVISEADKARDKGSDVATLRRGGVAVVLDRSPESLMHNKFAVVDASILLTGSYNWTAKAHRENHENLVVTSERRLVAAFKDRFEKLWVDFGPPATP
jgi:phosphatidylserine/phosphatidylglycerophosphate/cardiolipin synthase-like enzyme